GSVGRHPCRAHDPGHGWRGVALRQLMTRAAMPWCALAVAGVVYVLTPARGLSAQQATTTVARDDARFSFYDHGPYRAGVPRPEPRLGYPFAEKKTQYAAQEHALPATADAAKGRVHVAGCTATF